mgnify:CR=1 FL=1
MGEITNRDNKKMLILFAEMVAALATILIAVLAMKIPVVPCVIVLIEVAIAACLQEVPVWVHAVVAAVQLVAGAFCGRVVFCLLCILIYVFAILTLREARA